jgi:polysaccharide export outer membrane protein
MRLNSNLRQLLVAAIIGTLMLSSCGTVKDIAYFQNKVVNQPEKIDKHAGIVIQPKDMLSISVSSRNPELVAMFNLSLVQYTPGSEMGGAGGGQQRMLGYVVDNNGYIDFPVLGLIKVAGLTRWELSEMIKTRLVKDGLLPDAVITVEFMNFKVSVLGEVASPGTYTIQGDKVTILQALSLAGDLTIYGQRENVSVIRERDGERVFFQINLCDVDLFKSPAYYLQQNDVIYVEPSVEKARQSTIDDKKLRMTTIAISSSSLLVSVASLLVGILVH